MKAYFSSAREELLWRVKHRDTWLTLHLMSQLGLFALGTGVKLGGAKSSVANPSLLVLAYPIALLFTALYSVEDRLVGLLSNYVGAISDAEQQLSGAARLCNWDASPQLRQYVGGGTLTLRLFAQVCSFFVLPGLLVGWFTFEIGAHLPTLLVSAVFAAATVAVLVKAAEIREKTGQHPNQPLLDRLPGQATREQEQPPTAGEGVSANS